MSETIVKLTPSDLAALMCARICHDLVSPIGALSTALEVLDDESNADMHEDAMNLVRLSAGQASDKLKFLRMAFGASTSAPGIIAMDEVRELVDQMFKGGKANFHWETALDGLEKNQARLLLNLVMIVVQTIPRGGDLRIRCDKTGAAIILTLEAEGPKARIYDDYTRSLGGKAPGDGFDGRTIQPFYTGMLVREMKGRIDGAIEGEKVTYTAFLPIDAAQSAA